MADAITAAEAGVDIATPPDRYVLDYSTRHSGEFRSNHPAWQIHSRLIIVLPFINREAPIE
eukprot:scaffold30096_cov47-Prasinocladus_malaysianus.AAC.1